MSASWAPGRVNLIGEHTDYNLGYVLPVALELATEVEAATEQGQNWLALSSESYPEPIRFSLDTLAAQQPRHNWTDYIVGVAQQLLKLGVEIHPMTLMVRSTVPEGAGLSSSAALEVSSALAFLQGAKMEPLALAQLCQRAEREFVGVPSGIMDQYVSVFGRKGHAVLIDCRALQHEYVPVPGVEIWAVNSMVKHALGNSAYRERVEECAAAAEAMGVHSLRDATRELLGSSPMPDLIRRRARHIVTENERVLGFVAASKAGDLARMGSLFLASHASMRDDYEISCEEIDFLVETAAAIPGCFGARMTGGGFGGCTVNLLQPGTAEAFQHTVTERYRERFRLVPQFIRCSPGEGAVTELP